MTRAFACRAHDRAAGWSVLQLGLASAVWAGCALDDEPSDVGTRTAKLAVAGPWQIPPEVRAAGDAAEVSYVGGGAWDGEDGCTGCLTDHAVALRELLLWSFPQITFISDYACRPIGTSETRTSVHGVGRALDLHIPLLSGGEADNELGDPVGNWLVENAQVLGVQYVIWDGWQWLSSLEPGARDGPYGGSNPHRDHLHVEVTANPPELTETEPQLDTAADDESCLGLPAAGGLLDESGPCVERYGPEEFWRLDDSTGHDGSLYWTNTFTSDAPSNWARYTLWFEEAGHYLVRSHVPGGYGCFDAVRYEVWHAEGQVAVSVDQSASHGWVPVGTFTFAAGEEYRVEAFDDTLAEVDSQRRVVVDALRVDRVKQVAAMLSMDQEASPVVAPSTVLAPGMMPARAPAAEGEPIGVSPADPGFASPESAQATRSTAERSACTASAKTFRAPPGAFSLGILLAWLLRRTRRCPWCRSLRGRTRSATYADVRAECLVTCRAPGDVGARVGPQPLRQTSEKRALLSVRPRSSEPAD